MTGYLRNILRPDDFRSPRRTQAPVMSMPLSLRFQAHSPMTGRPVARHGRGRTSKPSSPPKRHTAPGSENSGQNG